ncbi:MAG: ABC transporter permease subunit, partial [Actinobacteria bacterium]
MTLIADTLGQPLIQWSWLKAHGGVIVSLVLQHILLTGIAVGIGFAISMVLAIYSVRHRRAYAPVTWLTGIMYTIPSIALFGFLVPLTGYTILSAEIGLVSYTLLILIRNIVAGIDSVPAEVREAAIAMGYRPTRLLLQIELPIALPTIVAGLRIATVTTIGLVTITSLITYGGLGLLILQGLQSFFPTKVVVGSVLSILLAALTD